MKYLRVTLDNKINWKTNIDNKTTACKKLMVLPNSSLRGMQAPKPKLSKWAYIRGSLTKAVICLHDVGELYKPVQQI